MKSLAAEKIVCCLMRFIQGSKLLSEIRHQAWAERTRNSVVGDSCYQWSQCRSAGCCCDCWIWNIYQLILADRSYC